MNVLDLSNFLAIVITIITVFIYIYLYLLYRQSYLGLWALGWSLHLGRILHPLILLVNSSTPSLFAFGFSQILSSVLVLKGTAQFLKTKQPRIWLAAAVIMLLIHTVILSQDDSSPFWKAFYPSVFAGIVFSWTSILFLRHLHLPGWGKYIVSLALITLGLQMLTLPLRSDSALDIWGYFISVLVKLLIAIGTLIVYFEKVKQDLAIEATQFRLLAENATDVIYRFMLLPVPHIDYVSPSVYNLLNYKPEEIYALDTNFINLVYAPDLPMLKMLLTNAGTTNNPVSFRLVHPNKTLVWVEQTYIPLLDNRGSIMGYEGIIRDITSRKTLELDVLRLERLNAVGEMAASVAHEIRNPMTTIRGYIQLFAQKEEFAKYKDQMFLLLDELDRTNQIIKEYLSLSRSKTVQLNLAQLNPIVDALYPLMQANAVSMNKNILIQLGNIPDLYLDQNEIRQLLLNLVRNGLEEMQDNGMITICTYREGDYAVLTVADQGTGIPEHILESLGQPFVTSKENGTGLGLTTCYRIANRHQATIEVKTCCEGTTFFIRFPIPKPNTIELKQQ